MAFSNNFATFLIIGPTCFFLGILFASFPYDYYVIWATPPEASLSTLEAAARAPYFSLLENHLKILYQSPPLINRILHTVIGTGFLGLMLKLYKPSEANLLFDGATLVLYMCGVTVYISNILRGMRMATAGVYMMEDKPGTVGSPVFRVNAGDVVGREDSLKVLSASNTILALLLVGVLILQAGQWYAQKKEAAELEAMDKAAEEKKGQKEKSKASAGDKKKQ